MNDGLRDESVSPAPRVDSERVMKMHLGDGSTKEEVSIREEGLHAMLVCKVIRGVLG